MISKELRQELFASVINEVNILWDFQYNVEESVIVVTVMNEKSQDESYDIWKVLYTLSIFDLFAWVYFTQNFSDTRP